MEAILIHFLSGEWMDACMHVFYSSTADIANSYMNAWREAFEEHDDDISCTKSSCNDGNDWGMVVVMVVVGQSAIAMDTHVTFIYGELWLNALVLRFKYDQLTSHTTFFSLAI